MALEIIGDWVIRKAGPKDRNCTHTVSGWGIRWACQSHEDARKVAEFLDRVTLLCQDVWVEE